MANWEEVREEDLRPVCFRCGNRRDRPEKHIEKCYCIPVVQRLADECSRLTDLIDTPHTADFLEAVPLEAAHQVKRWGTQHDAGKAPEDYFWLLGYLAGKCLRAAIDGDVAKAKHHTISVSAVCLNWHRRLSGEDQAFQPGTNTQ